MGGVLDLLAPYRQSFAFDELESDIQSLFIDVFTELYGEQVEDIHFYGMPHLGSANVIERFTKQDGLAVLRRPDSNDVTMRVIYANWKALASKRGLSFLEFILQMIWANKWRIDRLYHSSTRLDSYPTLVTTAPTVDSFLTSRINITLSDGVDIDEISEIAPILSRLVPANIVARISSGLELGDSTPLKVATAYIPYVVQNVQFYEGIDAIRIPMTDWVVLRKYDLLADGIARYYAYKTDLVSVVSSSATVDLSSIVLDVMVKPEYYQLQAIHDSLFSLDNSIIQYEVDVAGLKFKTASLPDDENLNLIEASQVSIQRMILSNNGDFVGASYVRAVFARLEWYLISGVVNHKVIAPLSMRSAYIYQSGSFNSFDSFIMVAQQVVADKVANDPDWANYTMGVLELQTATETQETYVKHYTYQEDVTPPTTDPENPPTQVFETRNGEYIIDVDRIDNPQFISLDHLVDEPVSQADLDNMIDRVMTDAQMQNNYSLMRDVNLLIESAYTKDASYPSTNTLYVDNLADVSFAVVAQQIIVNTRDSDLIYYPSAEAYLLKIVETIFSDVASDRLITIDQLIPQFNQNMT